MQAATDEAPCLRLTKAVALVKALAEIWQSNCVRLVVEAVPAAVGAVAATAVSRNDTEGIVHVTWTVPINSTSDNPASAPGNDALLITLPLIAFLVI
jgi:tripartite-type tricarboxylate transporter receptor subunit TctC